MFVGDGGVGAQVGTVSDEIEDALFLSVRFELQVDYFLGQRDLSVLFPAC